MEMDRIELGVVPEKTHKVVSDPVIARKLLQDGFSIVDIKAKKHAPKETVFVFKIEDGFYEKMQQYIQERKDRVAKKAEE